MNERKLTVVVVIETVVLAVLAWAALGSNSEPEREPGLPREQRSAQRQDRAAPLGGINAAPAAERTAAMPERRAVADSANATSDVLLFGSFLDTAGHPIEGATLYLRRAEGGLSIEVHNGHYAAFGVAAGTATLWADAPEYRARQDPIEIDGKQARLRHDIVLEGAVVLQVFARTPEGTPLVEAMTDIGLSQHGWRPGVLASASPLPDQLPLRDSASVVGLGEGRWSPASWRQEEAAQHPPDWLGSLKLQIDLPAHVALMLRQSVIGRQLVDPGADRVDFEVATDAIEGVLGSLRVEVVDVRGRPVAGARVGVSDAQSGGGGQPVGEDGVLVREHLPPGIWEIDVYAADHANHHSLVRVEPGQNAEARVTLTSPRVLGGTILDPSGQPTSATFQWDDLDVRRFPHELINRRSGRANAEGEFTIHGAGVGLYAIHAFGDGTAAHALADTTAGDVGDMELRLEPTTRTVVQSKGGKLAVHLLLVRTPQGLPVWASEVRGGIDTDFALPRGRYVAEIYRGTGLVRSFDLEVGAHEGKVTVP